METTATQVRFRHREAAVKSDTVLPIKVCVRDLNVAGVFLAG
jgi:hypothetical protein